MSKDKDFRSAKTGQYVTANYASRHPGSTVGEKRDPPKGGRKGGGSGKKGK